MSLPIKKPLAILIIAIFLAGCSTLPGGKKEYCLSSHSEGMKNSFDYIYYDFELFKNLKMGSAVDLCGISGFEILTIKWKRKNARPYLHKFNIETLVNKLSEEENSFPKASSWPVIKLNHNDKMLKIMYQIPYRKAAIKGQYGLIHHHDYYLTQIELKR